MTWSGWLFVATMCVVGAFYLRYVGISLSLSSLLLGLLLLFHGPMYLYYTRVFGPETDFFEQILAAAPGQPVIQTLDLALALCLTCVAIGVRLADRAYRVDGRRVRQATVGWGTAPIELSIDDARRLQRIMLGCIVVMLPFVLLDGQLAKVREFFTADLSAAEKVDFRREEGGSSFYFYNLLLSTFFSFVLFAGLAAWRLWHGRRAWVVAPLLVLAALVFLGKAATLSKAPAVILLLQCAAVVVMARTLRLNGRVVALLVLMAGAGFTLMTFVAVPDLDGLSIALEFVFYRTFMVVNEGLLEYFSAIPHVLDFSWGSQLSWIGALLQTDPQPPTYLLVGAVHRDIFGSTTTVMFLGDAWADFSWFGVVVVSVGAGFVVRALDIKLILQRGRSVGTIAAMAVGQYGVFTALNTSLQTALVTGGLAFVLAFASLISPRRRSYAASAALA